MGAIQSSINQALSVGAFLASQSPQLQQRAAKHAALKDIENRRGVIEQKTLEAVEGSKEQPELIKKWVEARKAGDEQLASKLEEEFKISSYATAKEADTLEAEATKLIKEQFELDPENPEVYERYREVLKREAKSDIEQEKAAEAEAAQKAERAKKDKRNERDRINRAVERALRKREAQEALANRRQEMGDTMYIGGKEFSSDHPLYKRVQEQLQKEDSQ
jgi:hypothetical protein